MWAYGGSLTIDAPITVGDNANDVTYDSSVYGFTYGQIDIEDDGAITTGSGSNVLFSAQYGGISQDAAISTDGGDVDMYSGNYGYAYVSSNIETTLNGTITTNGGDVSIKRFDGGDSQGSSGVTIGAIIDTSGAAGGDGFDGGNAGNVNIYNQNGDIALNAEIDASGGDGGSSGNDGGDGGNVTIDANYGTVTQLVTSTIDATGGDAYGASGDTVFGGDGGNVTIISDDGFTLNAVIDSYGGAAIDGGEGIGGDGGNVNIDSYGNIILDVTITATGGAASGLNQAYGGDGGNVSLDSDDGTVTQNASAAIDTSGGSGTGLDGGEGYGGDGGRVAIDGYYGVTLNTTITTVGGAATGGNDDIYGGDGGYVEIDSNDGSVTLNEFAAINTSGGSGTADGGEGFGGRGGRVDIESEYDVSLYSTITTVGGAASGYDYAEAGDGGTFEVDVYDGEVTQYAGAAIDTSGGEATVTGYFGFAYGGDGGNAEFGGEYGVTLNETVTTSGGAAATGNYGDADGGEGGLVGLGNDSYGDITLNSTIDTSGGNATGGEGSDVQGGGGGFVFINGGEGLVNLAESGTVTTSGGIAGGVNAYANEATGGKAGGVFIDGGEGYQYGGSVVINGTITATGGNASDARFAFAGDGGDVDIGGGGGFAFNGAAYNGATGGDVTLSATGTIDTSGGDAEYAYVAIGGGGGDVRIEGGVGFAIEGSNYTLYGGEGARGGNVTVTGLIDSSGGNGAYGDVYAGGGNGGDIRLYGGEAVAESYGNSGHLRAVGGDVEVTGTTLTASGGNANSAENVGGGDGGDVRIEGGYAGAFGGEGQLVTYGGAVTLYEADLNSTGGTASDAFEARGGEGGEVDVRAGDARSLMFFGEALLASVGGDVTLTYSEINASGGAASDAFNAYGGDGYGIEIDGGDGQTSNYGGYSYASYASYAFGGDVELYDATLDNSGGSGTASHYASGGDGGYVAIDGGEGARFSGGDGMSGGGSISLEYYSEVITSGGAAYGGSTFDGGEGGDAGDVFMFSGDELRTYGEASGFDDYGTFVIDADSSVTMAGGYAYVSDENGGADGGDGGEGFFGGEGGISISGTIDASGGAATADYANGGNAGTILVTGKYGGAYEAAVSIDGTLTAIGGEADGLNSSDAGNGGGILIMGVEGGEGAPAVDIDGTIETNGENGSFIGILSENGDIEMGEYATITGGGEGASVTVVAGKFGGSYDLIMDADATITASEGEIDINASGDVTLGQLSVGYAGSSGYDSNAVFVGAEGSIESADSGNITNISTDNGGYVGLYANSGIGSDDEGYENVITLSADGGDGALELDAYTYNGDINVSVDGSLYISNYSVEIDGFSASADDNITLDVSGDIFLGNVDNNGAGNVTLTAGGSITASGGEGGAIEANGDVNLTGIGIGDGVYAINVSGGEGSDMNLTATGGEGGEINVDAYFSSFDNLTITLEDADSDVFVGLASSDYVAMSADGVDVTLDDMRTTGSGINVSIYSEDGDADVVTAQGTANLGGDLSLSSADDIVLGDGSGGVVINAYGNAVSLTADSDGTDGGAIVNPNGGIISFGSFFGGSLELNAGDGIGADGAAVQIIGAEGFSIAAATEYGDVVIDSSGGGEMSVSEVGDLVGISSGDGDVTLAADDLNIGAEVSGDRVTLTTSTASRSIDIGAEGFGGALNLSEEELGQVSADILQIGDTGNSGGIVISQAVSFTAAGHDDVHLQTGSGSITDDASSGVQVGGLAITSGGTVTLDGDNQVTTLAVDHIGGEGSVTFNDFNALEIGEVDGVNGVSAYNVTLSAGGAITDDGDSDNIITAQYLTIENASSVGNIEAGLSFDAYDVEVIASGNIVLESVGADGVTINASVTGGEGGIAIYSATENVYLEDVITEDGDILAGVDNDLYAYNVVAGSEAAADGDIIMLALGDITVANVSAGYDLIFIAADGDIDFVGAGGEGETVGGGHSTLTLAAGGNITFDNADFGSEEDPIGTLNVASATDFTIVSPYDVYTLDIGTFSASGTVDFGDTLVVLGDGNISISAGNIFGELSAADAATVVATAGGVLGEVNLELEIDNPFIVNTEGTLFFNAAGGVIEGVFGAGSVVGVGVGGEAVGTFGWLGALDGTTFQINGVTVVFESLVNVEDIIDSIVTNPTIPDAEVDLSGPSALQSTSTFVADIFTVDFSLGTNLSVAPAAGGDGEEGGDGGDGGGDFLGDFWGSLIETAPDEDAEDGGDSAGEDIFNGDDDDDDDEEDDLVFDDE